MVTLQSAAQVAYITVCLHFTFHTSSSSQSGFFECIVPVGHLYVSIKVQSPILNLATVSCPIPKMYSMWVMCVCHSKTGNVGNTSLEGSAYNASIKVITTVPMDFQGHCSCLE